MSTHLHSPLPNLSILSIALAALPAWSGAAEEAVLGEVKVKRYPGGDPNERPDLELYGEFLAAFPQQQIMRSHLPARVLGMGADMQVKSFDYNHLTGQLRFSGGGRATFSTRPGAVSTGAAAKAATPAASAPAARQR